MRENENKYNRLNFYHSHMRSQDSVCAAASREKDGSWTMMSPFEVVDHRACLDGGPVIPRHSQQQSDSRISCRHRTTAGNTISRWL